MRTLRETNNPSVCKYCSQVLKEFRTSGRVVITLYSLPLHTLIILPILSTGKVDNTDLKEYILTIVDRRRLEITTGDSSVVRPDW